MTDEASTPLYDEDILSVAASVALCGAHLLYMQEVCIDATTLVGTWTYIDMKGCLRRLREAMSQ